MSAGSLGSGVINLPYVESDAIPAQAYEQPQTRVEVDGQQSPTRAWFAAFDPLTRVSAKLLLFPKTPSAAKGKTSSVVSLAAGTLRSLYEHSGATNGSGEKGEGKRMWGRLAVSSLSLIFESASSQRPGAVKAAQSAPAGPKGLDGEDRCGTCSGRERERWPLVCSGLFRRARSALTARRGR